MLKGLSHLTETKIHSEELLETLGTQSSNCQEARENEPLKSHELNIRYCQMLRDQQLREKVWIEM